MPTSQEKIESAPGGLAVCHPGKSCERNLTATAAMEEVRSSKSPLWLHVHVTDREATIRLLEDDLGFHELAVEDALSPNERPALTQYDDYIFLVVPAIAATGEKEDYVEIAFFLRKNLLVTVADRACPIIQTWQERWSRAGNGIKPNVADLLHMIIDGVVDAYLPVIEQIEDDVDDIGDMILEGERGKSGDLLRAKRRLLNLRRRVIPLRDVINQLLRRDLDLIPEKTRPYFQDVYDHVSRIAESIDLQRDTLTSLLDVHLSVVSNNLNEVMKKMTVIATVLMTAALIAGIYGMNFKRMPELDWYWGYPFALLLMVVSSVGILGLFKWKKWL